MGEPVLLLLEDGPDRDWAPFALTRPVSELLLGLRTLRERSQAYWGISCSAILSNATQLGSFGEVGTPPVLPRAEAARWENRPRVVIRSRVAALGRPPTLPERSTPLALDGTRVGWYLAPGDPLPPAPLTAGPGDLPPLAVDGELLDGPWRLVDRNPEFLARDLANPGPGWRRLEAGSSAGVTLHGPHPVWLGAEVSLDPGVILDTREGGIALADGVQVKGFTLLEGPLFAGPGTRILGGNLSAMSAGPQCRLRGEISHTILLGYANKAHDGYLGHALVGRWVNLGAFTTNSDLKNNYRPVRVPLQGGGSAETGLLKVGAFLGDHVRTGIGTLLNTGSVVGAGSNLFGGVMPPTLVPPFSWGSGAEPAEYRLEAFLEVARTVMARRGLDLMDRDVDYLTGIWREGRRQAAADRPSATPE